MIRQFFCDDDGNLSMMRLITALGIVVFVFLLYLFAITLFEEISRKDEPINYTGLATLFTAMVLELYGTIYGKVHQKKIEKLRRKNETEET